MAKGNKGSFLNIEIFHFGRKTGTIVENPVEIYNYNISSFINKNSVKAIKPRTQVYLVPCNNSHSRHRIGDGECEFLSPEMPQSQAMVNALLLENANHMDPLVIEVGESLEKVTKNGYAIYKQVEIPELLIESRCTY